MGLRKMNNLSPTTELALRKLVTLIAGALISKGLLTEGWMDSSIIELVVGVIMLLVSIFWSKTHAARLLNTSPPTTDEHPKTTLPEDK